MGVFAVSGESVIVVMDANRNRGNVDALNWALSHVVRPKDTVVVLGILCEFGKKSSCLPFYMGIGISAIWERLEFSGPGEVAPRVLEEEILNKREEYQCILQPFYRQCKKNEVKLEVKLAAGFCPRTITMEEAQNRNTRWIVLDSHFWKDRVYLYAHLGCNIAIMKGSDVATLMPSIRGGKDVESGKVKKCEALNLSPELDEIPLEEAKVFQEEEGSTSPHLSSPYWSPLCWLPGFPRIFSCAEIDSITNGFADDKILCEDDDSVIYEGILMDTPIIVKHYNRNDNGFWSQLTTLSRVRHRNIMNFIGYCCIDGWMCILFDFPCNGSLKMQLESDNHARSLTWKVRWDIALEIGRCLRYLHEECPDEPIWHLSVSSSNVVVSHNFSASICNFNSAKWIREEGSCDRTASVEGLVKYIKEVGDGCHSPDVYAYGLLLLELITGKIACDFTNSGEGQSFAEWALPFLENGSLSEVVDQRLMESSDVKEVNYMACAALRCLKNDSGRQPSMSEVLDLSILDQLNQLRSQMDEKIDIWALTQINAV